MTHSSFTSAGEAVEVLDQCLALAMDWRRANRLMLNPDKMKALLVGSSLDQMGGRWPALDWVTPPFKKQVCNLGIRLEPLLLLDPQTAGLGGVECLPSTHFGWWPSSTPIQVRLRPCYQADPETG